MVSKQTVTFRKTFTAMVKAAKLYAAVNHLINLRATPPFLRDVKRLVLITQTDTYPEMRGQRELTIVAVCTFAYTSG
jgi:hypothetical protein